jgi:hypothetical protein
MHVILYERTHCGIIERIETPFKDPEHRSLMYISISDWDEFL